MGIGAAVAAVALGATVIEKHFTLSRADGGVDSTFSLEPAELQALVLETGRAWQALGHVSYGPTEAEKSSLAYRRSLYVVRDVAAGGVLTRDNVRAIRPGSGLPPKYLDQILGRKASRDLRKGTPMAWDLLG
jgi:sialic acid synthase SpsE